MREIGLNCSVGLRLNAFESNWERNSLRFHVILTAIVLPIRLLNFKLLQNIPKQDQKLWIKSEQKNLYEKKVVLCCELGQKQQLLFTANNINKRSIKKVKERQK